MIVTRFFEPLLAQASYLLGCSAAGKAIVIDPHRDISVYLEAAAAAHLEIAYVTETHIHADFLSGSRELAARSGATLLLSDEGDADWKYAFGSEGQLIRAGDVITLGNVRLEVLHTPGHTPEHVSFLVTDGAVANEPIAALTGDFIFVGDVGRPDLLERAAHMAGTMESGARTLFRSLQHFNAAHEEWLQLWPGHGAGSSCGKGISAVPHSTLGYERRFNWAFKETTEDGFVAAVLSGQPDPPTYFAMMKRLNKEGPRLRGEAPALPPTIEAAQLRAVLAAGGLVVDTRPAASYAAGSLTGTINLPFNGSFVTWAGWLVPYTSDIVLIVDSADAERVAPIVRALSLIGLDRVIGVAPASVLAAAGALQTIRQIEPRELAGMRGEHTPVVIDVRSDAEWAAGHLPAAVHIPLGRLGERLRELPQGQALVMQCQAGARSAIAASLLRRAGFADVSNLVGGYDNWRKQISSSGDFAIL